MLDGDDRAAIFALEQNWLEAECAGAPGRVGAWLSEDCVLCPPDKAPVQGRKAVIAAMRGPFPIADIALSEVELHGGPAHAWKTARFRTRFDNRGEDVIITGRHCWVLQKTGNEWRVCLLSYQIDA